MFFLLYILVNIKIILVEFSYIFMGVPHRNIILNFFLGPPKMQKADKIKKVSPIKHVLIRPDMYVGSQQRDLRKEWHFNGKKITYVQTDVPEGMIQLYKEIISNVADNSHRSRAADIDPGECDIKVEGDRITVRNEGMSIELEYSKKYKEWSPETIFGSMLSGTNLGKKRNAGGANGIGATAANILSNEFTVDIKNATQRKQYYQVYTKHNSERTEANIKKFKGDTSSVSISWVIDHKIFNYSKEEFTYSKSAIQIFRWIAASLSFMCNIPVTFNGKRMEYDLEDYGRLFVDQMDKYITYSDDDTKVLIIDAPGKGKQLGFANYIINTNGGVHVAACLTAIKESLTITKKSASSDTKKAAPSDPKITVTDLKPHIFVIVSVINVNNPGWGDGQTKKTFTGPKKEEGSKTAPKFKISIPKATLDEIKTWSLPKMLKASLDAKSFAKMTETTTGTTKGKYMQTKRGEDATCAGTSKGYLCGLYAVEGDSAEGYLADLLDFIPGGRKYVGTLTLRGKPLNVLKHNMKKIEKNKEIQEVIRRLNLRMGVDYTVEKNLRTLRYGFLVMMADSDLDGIHIKAILLAIFHKFFPSLLHAGFVVDYMTPIIRATKGSGEKAQVLKFYFQKEFEDWKLKTPDHVDKTKGGKAIWNYQYFKGLGSSLREHIEDDYNTRRIIKLVYDKRAAAKMEMALGNEHQEEKKQWIQAWDPNCVEAIHKEKLMISKFVDQFLRSYSHCTLARHLPSYKDGLTNARRKIVWTIFKRWGRKCGSTASVRIPDFSGTVCEGTRYHHSDVQTSIINLAQEFVGSNNLPLLIGKGRFGSIEKGGKHAAQPRYLEVRPSPLLPYIFRAEDDTSLKILIDEGVPVEPEFMLSIIPLGPINGIDAVSVGWRSLLPNYHPMEIIEAYQARLRGVAFTELVPWYRGYIGEMYLEDGAFISKGIVTAATEDSYTLTCLPVGMWNNKYKKRLMKQVLEDKISGYKSNCSATRTYFEVKGMVVTDKDGNQKPLNLDDIGVIGRKPLNNIVMLDNNDMPVTYDSIAELLEAFYQFRLPFYKARKVYLLKTVLRDIELLVERQKYIQAVVKGKLKFMVKKIAIPKEDILAKIDELGLQPGFYVKRDGYTIVTPNEYSAAKRKKLRAKQKVLEESVESIKKLKIETMWNDDLEELKKEYKKIYKNDERITLL
jgi:DNA topoisomerase-2